MQLKHALKPLSKTLMIARPATLAFAPLVQKMAPKESFLRSSFADTYWRLRALMAIIAFTFPAAIPLAGKWFYGIPYGKSLSAYYFATAEVAGAEPRMRVWFFGGLLALGICLFAYKGYSKLEDKLLTLAGGCAMGVAIRPMPWPEGSGSLFSWSSLHFVFALLLFGALIWVCVGCSQQTLKEADDETRKIFEPLYYLTGLGMLTFPVTAMVWTWIIGRLEANIFWMELFGVWTFAVFWTLKNAELRSTSAGQPASTEEMAVTVGLPQSEKRKR